MPDRVGELLLGVKRESPEGIAMADEICAVAGLGFAEMGPGDLSLSLGSVKLLRDPYPPVMQAARDKVFAACRRNGIAFLEGCNPANIADTRFPISAFWSSVRTEVGIVATNGLSGSSLRAVK